jgi:predicted MFS family arabinose efflux permease
VVKAVGGAAGRGARSEARNPARPVGVALAGDRVGLAIVLLMLIYTFNFIDRQILNVLAEPIARELQLSDTQIGLMTGLSFALFYTLLGIPLARFTDRPTTDRVWLISACLALWSGMTAVSAAAGNFYHLLLARIGVAAGEAGCTPAATSLIADLAPRERRARAMAFYGLGLPIGTLFGLTLGGLIADAWGWRAAFLVVGLPGIALAVVFAGLVRDPRARVALAERRTRAIEGAPLGEVLREIAGSKAFMWMLVGSSAGAFLSYGKGVWQIVFLIRTHDLSPGQVGLWIGLASGVFGILGTWLGGWLADRYGAKDPRHYLTAPIIGALITFPLLIAAYTVSDWRLALALMAVPYLLSGLSFGPTFAAIAGLVRPQSRAMAVSVKLFVQTIVGLGLGPLALGALSDALKPLAGDDSVRWVLLAVVSLTLVSAWGDWIARRHIRREMVHAETVF